VLGSEEFVQGFKLAGVRKVYSCKESALAERLVEVLADKGIGVLIMRDSWLMGLPQGTRARLRASVRPVLITLGGAEEDLRDKVRRAIGIDLFKGR